MLSPDLPASRSRPSTIDSCECIKAECPAHEGRRVRVIDWVKGLSRIALWEEGTVVACNGSTNLIVRLDIFTEPRLIPTHAVKVVQEPGGLPRESREDISALSRRSAWRTGTAARRAGQSPARSPGGADLSD